jgi:hypothetical protein
MAGSDTIDPAKVYCPALHIFPTIHAMLAMLRMCAGPLVTAGWISHIIANCQRLSWTRELQWSENMPRAGEPPCSIGCAC